MSVGTRYLSLPTRSNQPRMDSGNDLDQAVRRPVREVGGPTRDHLAFTWAT